MKSLIVATMLSAAAIVSTAAPSQAASVTVTTTDHGPNMHHRWHRVATHCYVKTARFHEHGRWVVKKTRVCR